MSTVISNVAPEDCGSRIKSARGIMGLTQTQFANLIGVSFASVNRWENGQSRPNNLAWQRIVELEREAASSPDVGQDHSATAPTTATVLDFAADPKSRVRTCRGASSGVGSPLQSHVRHRNVVNRPTSAPTHRRI